MERRARGGNSDRGRGTAKGDRWEAMWMESLKGIRSETHKDMIV